MIRHTLTLCPTCLEKYERAFYLRKLDDAAIRRVKCAHCGKTRLGNVYIILASRAKKQKD